MTRGIRRRIIRDATPEEKERHRAIRAEIGQELPELKQWAREVAARHRERVAVGTVFTDQESGVLDAIDDYAMKLPCPVEEPSCARPWPRHRPPVIRPPESAADCPAPGDSR